MHQLNVGDTGALEESLSHLNLKASDDYTEMEFEQQFNEYGIFVDAGTGREIKRGNPGDIGRAKVRRAQPWFYKKYYRSYRNILEFMAENLGEEIATTISETLDAAALRKNVFEKPKN